MRPSMRNITVFRNRLSASAFTLIEVLVVVTIIALLMAILLPSLSRARAQTRRVACLANLHNIHMASMSYVQVFRERLPDSWTLGLHQYRRAPGLTDPTQPVKLKEIFGLEATLEKTRCMAKSDAWICPASANSWMKEYQNTYAFTAVKNGVIDRKPYNSLISTRNPVNSSNTYWIWDNYTLKPGQCGLIGPFSPVTVNIASADRFYPHDYIQQKSILFGQKRAINVAFLAGHIGQIPQ